MPTRTKFVILMHPYEFKRIKANTGRLTHLCLADSEVHIGIEFDNLAAVQALINDPSNYPVLLYPGRDALDLSAGSGILGQGAGGSDQAGTAGKAGDDPGARTQPPAAVSALAELQLHLSSRRLVVFLLDATWRLVRPMLRLSPSLQRLPKIMFSGAAPSRYIIKRQPEPGCLSTLEAAHELLVALDRSGLDHYAMPEQLLAVFQRMQDIQLKHTAENQRLGISRYNRPIRSKTAGPRPVPKRRRIFPKTGADPFPPSTPSGAEA